MTKYTLTATQTCPSIANKRVTAHTLRHTAAMRLLEKRTDTAVISLWLGHSSTRSSDAYLHAHQGLKEQALARTTPPNTPVGRYRPPDRLLAFLEAL